MDHLHRALSLHVLPRLDHAICSERIGNCVLHHILLWNDVHFGRLLADRRLRVQVNAHLQNAQEGQCDRVERPEAAKHGANGDQDDGVDDSLHVVYLFDHADDPVIVSI